MKKIKHVIFGLRNLVIENDEGSSTGAVKNELFDEFTRLINFLKLKGVEPVVFANDGWKLDDQDAEKALAKYWGELKWFETIRDKMPPKPTADAMAELLKRLQCERNEVLYIGNSERDMQTAVNGGVLFLNGTWLKQQCDYGFQFETAKAIAKFIDVFCLRSKGWAFEINDGPLRYRSLAPFSTKYSGYEYSDNAVRTKEGWGQPEFWGPYLCATLFLTDLYKEFDYVCPFPRHEANKWNEPLRESIATFAKCFRKKYIPDLVVRHTTTPSSRYNPDALKHVDHLSSIMITEKPTKSVSSGSKYVKSPLSAGKTVMVVDDFCTKGRSIEAARIYLEKTGVKVILLSWLKTINRDYNRILSTGSFHFDPYAKTDWSKATLTTKAYPYSTAMTDDEAHSELNDKFNLYRTWDWPKEIK